MKLIKLFAAIASLALITVTTSHAATVTGFGTGQFAMTFTDFTSTSQTATYFEVSGTDFGQSLFGTFSSIAVPETTPQLQLAALKTAGTAVSNFQIRLYDSSANELRYEGSWAELPNGVPSVANLNFSSAVGTWDGTAVSLGLFTTGSGATLTVQLDNLAAVPEPTTIALLGTALAGGVVMLRRRRASSLS